MPVVWPPVKSITSGSGQVYRQLVDGGIRNVSPLGDVIDSEPDEVVIINCNSEDFQPYANLAKNMLKIARRALTEITLNEIFLQDIRAFLHINNIITQLPPEVIVKKLNGTPYKKYHSILIEPDHDLGDALDFDREKINQHIKEGYKAAQKVYESLNLQIQS
jgi:NTE family protein